MNNSEYWCQKYKEIKEISQCPPNVPLKEWVDILYKNLEYKNEICAWAEKLCKYLKNCGTSAKLNTVEIYLNDYENLNGYDLQILLQDLSNIIESD